MVTFNTDLGNVISLTSDILSMTGTAPVLAVSENVQGIAPSFASLDPDNSLPLGSATLTDLSDLYMTVAGLEEGVAYYFRVSASNYIGAGSTASCCVKENMRLSPHTVVLQHYGTESVIVVVVVDICLEAWLAVAGTLLYVIAPTSIVFESYISEGFAKTA